MDLGLSCGIHHHGEVGHVPVVLDDLHSTNRRQSRVSALRRSQECSHGQWGPCELLRRVECDPFSGRPDKQLHVAAVGFHRCSYAPEQLGCRAWERIVVLSRERSKKTSRAQSRLTTKQVSEFLTSRIL
jgi:hypothetical protein